MPGNTERPNNRNCQLSINVNKCQTHPSYLCTETTVMSPWVGNTKPLTSLQTDLQEDAQRVKEGLSVPKRTVFDVEALVLSLILLCYQNPSRNTLQF